MTRGRSFLAFALCVLPSAFLIAQQQPTFRGGAALVTVDVYPQQNGQIVEGLKPEDFEVLEDGKPQKVENFDFVRIEPAVTEDARRDPNSGDEGNKQAADPRSRVFVAYLDQYHVAFDGSHATRKPLVDTLRNVMTPADLFGVLTPKMRARDLTFARKLMTLEDELTKYWPWGERFALMHDEEEDYLISCFGTTRDGTPRMVEDQGVLRKLITLLIERRREDKTLRSLEDLVAHLGTLREARTVVLLFTDGYLLFEPSQRLMEEAGKGGSPMLPGVYRRPGGTAMSGTLDRVGDDAACRGELLRLANLDDRQRFRDLMLEANRRNVSFYPINPGGLAAFDMPISEPVYITESGLAKGEGPLTFDRSRLTERVQWLRTLAENTDGLAVVDTNDIAAGLRKVVNDVSAYYLLGYYSTNTKLDGSYHRIQVKLKRPGVAVKARRGYFAPVAAEEAAKAAKTAAAAVEAPVTAALASLSRLRPAAELFCYGIARAGALDLVVEIPSAAAGKFAQGADVEAAIFGPDNVSIGTMKGRIEPASRATLLSLPVPAGSAGPWRVDVKVSAAADRLQDRAQIESRQATGLLGAPIVYRAAPGPRSPIRPVADFQFLRTERVHVEWPMLKPLDQRQARLLGRTGQALAVGPTVTERQVNNASVLAVDLNLAPLTTGDYVIEVTAGSGSEAERRLLAIRVVQ